MVEPSYWESISEEFKKEVSNCPLVSIPESTQILIVGSGFCGLWLAYFLKKHHPQLQITLVDRDPVNGARTGASTRNAGFLSCGNISEWMEDARELSWTALTETLLARISGIELIKSEFQEECVFENLGSGDFDAISDAKIEFMNKLNAFLESKQLSPFFKLDKALFGRGEQSIFFNAYDLQTDPCKLLFALRKLLLSLGVVILGGIQLKQVSNHHATVVQISQDESKQEQSHLIRYEYAFICTNAFIKTLYPKSHVEPARGQILVTSECTTPTLKTLGFLKSGYDYFRFIGNRVLVGGGRLHFKEMENTSELSVTNELKNYLVTLATKVIGHTDFKVEHHWSGIMGLRKGQHASIQDLLSPVQMDPSTEAVAGFGGWGVTLTPYVAQELAKRFKSS